MKKKKHHTVANLGSVVVRWSNVFVLSPPSTPRVNSLETFVAETSLAVETTLSSVLCG